MKTEINELKHILYLISSRGHTTVFTIFQTLPPKAHKVKLRTYLTHIHLHIVIVYIILDLTNSVHTSLWVILKLEGKQKHTPITNQKLQPST